MPYVLRKYSAAVSLLLIALVLWAPLARSEVTGEGAGIVLSGLPPHNSKEYMSLRKIAGRITSQTLEMTKCEVWHVPTDRVEALLKAAAANGVAATRLDATWNHPLSPMNSQSQMTAKQKQMMSQAMDSKAAMGISTMELPPANIMEYALTKDMKGASKDTPAPELVIPLNDAATVTARRTSVKPAGDAYVWRGQTIDTNEAVTLMWWPGGRMTGTISYKGRIYAIKSMGGTMHGVIEMSPDALPPEHAPMLPEKMREMNMKVDPLVQQGDASALLDAIVPSKNGAGHVRGTIKNLQDAAPGAKPAVIALHAPKRLPRKTHMVTIDMLVAYTAAAASHYDNIERDLIALAIEDANESMINSGIANVRLRVVKTMLSNYVESGGYFEHVYKLLQKNDGVMDDIPRVRDQVRADVAVLITHDTEGCGLASKVAADADSAFAAVNHECAATMFSLAHEIGHLIGARHDRALDENVTPFPYGHGFVNGQSWRTMMSYKESCGGCPRLPVWSNPQVRINAVPAGDERSNNARVIASQAQRVAAFR